MRIPAAALAVLLASSAAHAQNIGGTGTSASASMAELVADGYEIRAAAPSGNRYVVFMQKAKSAYACEFVNVTTTRCRPIN